MKKIINDPKNVVTEMLEGIKYTNSNLELDKEQNIIYRKSNVKKVGLVSGGGSGHEPAHAGYVQKGMLDAAVCGNVFASPDPFSILEGIKKANHGLGVILIIKNYSGDIMNFEMAAEMAVMEGIDVKTIVVNDDISISDRDSRRGIAGTVLVHKILGNAAEEGKTIDELMILGNTVVKNLRSYGVSLSSCTIPEVGTPIFEIDEDEMEVGMGIHGEPGVKRQKIMSSDEISKKLIDAIISDDVDYEDGNIFVLINGLGGTPLMELYIVANSVKNILNDTNILVDRATVGNFMTSLEMQGMSITFLKLTDEISKHLYSGIDNTMLGR